ncbi:hypothetical protein A2943_02035 [Candidatus Adlerbacteria bacterium RIFCSPLOWO2_01_FULL_51_16]|uniref:Response regulatory domain-containing protein n=1 Tax=Candidatus Adlerbacteria bacterium RIFCSPLOWO2_01_FULL_51_16 TaxID=1797243 RepID=A0A1F4XHI1_9BACT|nr:MAG: hypothetical protein A2943_02035 [Candidatus Adlerbacteria bacterium RIFCSPLOWO2_01_FULL_51_16]
MAKFFIAEDDPLMSHMYERAFKFSGHETTLAHDGEEALATLKAATPKPDVIVLDIMMPKMSGFDVLKNIKEDETLKNIPVVLLTNLAGKEDAQKGLAMGAVLYLIKSDYNPKQVVEKISSLLPGKSGQ